MYLRNPMKRTFRLALLAGVAALAVSACATNRTNVATQPDFGSLSAAQQSSTLGQLAARYKANPRDKATIIVSSGLPVMTDWRQSARS